MIDLTVKTSGGMQTLEVREMPPEIFEWQRQARIKNLEAIMNDGMFEGFGPHLPTMSVLNAEGDFPVNSAAKGVGLIPKPEFMEGYLAKFTQLIEEAVVAGWKSSMVSRVQALLDFYQTAGAHRPHRTGQPGAIRQAHLCRRAQRPACEPSIR